MTAREQQVKDALEARTRQVEQFVKVEDWLVQHDYGFTHHGYGLCVKDRKGFVYAEPDDEDYEPFLAYERACEEFWNCAEEIARSHGFHGVWAAGRSGGWLVVNPQPHTDDMYEGEKIVDWLRDVFGPFALEIEALLAHYQANWREIGGLEESYPATTSGG